MPQHPLDWLCASLPVYTLISRESRGYDAIVSLFLQKLLLRGHNVRYKVMEPFIHFRVSLEINNGQMESLNASDVKLFAVKVTPKWMGVNGMLTAGEGLIANGGRRGWYGNRDLDYPPGLYPWKVLPSQAVFRLEASLKAALPSPIGSRMIGWRSGRCICHTYEWCFCLYAN